jgi:phosphonate transport system substrate-binding protein
MVVAWVSGSHLPRGTLGEAGRVKGRSALSWSPMVKLLGTNLNHSRDRKEIKHMVYQGFIKRVLILCAVMAIIAGAVGGGATAAELQELNFGIISTESSQNLKKGFEPFLEDMSKALGVKVNAFFAPDYAGVIEAMRFNKVHLAWFGNKSAMEAVDRAEGEIFAQTVDVDGNPGYSSLLITHKDSDIKSLDDVIKSGQKYTFGNGDPNSTSGFLVPAYYVFAVNKIDPKTHFKNVRSANHETNALAVANKQVDLATNNTENMSLIKKNQPEKYEQIRIVWQSPLIASDPLVWRKDLSEDMKAKIKAFILGYGRIGNDTERQKQVLAGMSSGWKPFRESNNDQLMPIRQLALYKDKTKIEGDTNLDAKEKEARLAVINGKLAELEKRMIASK